MDAQRERRQARRSAPRQLSGRGLAYWTDGRGDDRIIYVTPGYMMVALHAKTGAPVASFGKNGIVDLKQDDDQNMDLITGEVGLHAAPVVVEERHRHRRGASARRRAEEQDQRERATCAASMSGPASGSGSSTPSRVPASSETTRG